MSLVVWDGMAEGWLEMLLVHGPQLRASRFVIFAHSFHVLFSLMGLQEITKAHHKVVDLFKQNLAKSQAAPVATHSTDDSGSVTAMTQDILILLLPYLSFADATALFQTCLSSEVLGSKDNGVQKRGYKILAKLVDNEKVAIDAENILRRLDELAEGLSPAAKKVRLMN
jgi:ribosomal RNA-processing protein 12